MERLASVVRHFQFPLLHFLSMQFKLQRKKKFTQSRKGSSLQRKTFKAKILQFLLCFLRNNFTWDAFCGTAVKNNLKNYGIMEPWVTGVSVQSFVRLLFGHRSDSTFLKTKTNSLKIFLKKWKHSHIGLPNCLDGIKLAKTSTSKK